MILFLNLDENGNPADYEQIFWGLDASSFFIRPVAVVVGPCKAYGECIFFSDDSRGAVYALAYVGPEGQIPLPPTSVPVAPPVAPVDLGQPVTLYATINDLLAYLYLTDEAIAGRSVLRSSRTLSSKSTFNKTQL